MAEYIWYHWFGNIRIGILKMRTRDFIQLDKTIHYLRIGRLDFWEEKK